MAAAKARANVSAARATESVDGTASWSPRSRAIDVEIDAGHPARVDELEVLEVHRDIERDPVVAHATFDAEAEGTDLARRRPVRVAPAARMAVPARRGDAIRGAGLHERRLERADEWPQEQAALVQRDDRVRDQLAGAVIRDLAAALDADDVDAPALEVRLGRADVRGIAVAPERQHGRMLEQQQLVADQAISALGDEPFLERVRGSVAAPAEPAGDQRRARRGGVGAWGEDRGIHARTIAGPTLRAVGRRRRGRSQPPKIRSIAATIARPSRPPGSFSGL